MRLLTVALPRPSAAAWQVNIAGYQGQDNIMYPSMINNQSSCIGVAKLLIRKLQLARQNGGEWRRPHSPGRTGGPYSRAPLQSGMAALFGQGG